MRVWFIEEMIPRFDGRILALAPLIMIRWGELVARLEQEEHNMPAMDSLIAATALIHHLVLVTRNVAGFHSCGVELFNPWEIP